MHGKSAGRWDGRRQTRKGRPSTPPVICVPASRQYSGEKTAAPNQLQWRVRTRGPSAEEAESRPSCGLVLCKRLLVNGPCCGGSHLSLSGERGLESTFRFRLQYAPEEEKCQRRGGRASCSYSFPERSSPPQSADVAPSEKPKTGNPVLPAHLANNVVDPHDFVARFQRGSSDPEWWALFSDFQGFGHAVRWGMLPITRINVPHSARPASTQLTVKSRTAWPQESRHPRRQGLNPDPDPESLLLDLVDPIAILGLRGLDLEAVLLRGRREKGPHAVHLPNPRPSWSRPGSRPWAVRSVPQEFLCRIHLHQRIHRQLPRMVRSP